MWVCLIRVDHFLGIASHLCIHNNRINMFDDLILIYLFTVFQLFIIQMEYHGGNALSCSNWSTFSFRLSLGMTCAMCLSLRQGNVPLYCECWLNIRWWQWELARITYIASVSRYKFFHWPSLFSSFSAFFTSFFIIFIQFIQPKIVPVLLMEVSAFLYGFPRLYRFYSNHMANWHNSKSPFALVFVVSPYQCLFEHVLPFITSSIATWTTHDILNWYFAFATNTVR